LKAADIFVLRKANWNGTIPSSTGYGGMLCRVPISIALVLSLAVALSACWAYAEAKHGDAPLTDMLAQLTTGASASVYDPF